MNKAASEHMPDPKVPAYGISSDWKSVHITIYPNPSSQRFLQASFVRQALLGIMVYCAGEGWAQRTVEIHHDVLGYVGNIDFSQIQTKSAAIQTSTG